jgi:hypothetical protein
MLLAVLCIGMVKAEGIVKGRILDQNHHPVEFATAALLNVKTKLPVKGSTSNSKGDFVIEKVHEGVYILSITMVGYKKYESEKITLNDGRELRRDIVLHEDAQMLKEATVVGKRKFIEQQVDKMVINPEASIIMASENILDILKKTPGVNVDNNDNISLKGKVGVQVMIDNKSTYLSPEQLAALLRGMRGKDVDCIEVIENPSSRYDAEGNSGIINIKTKHNKRAGFNGSIFGDGSYNGKVSEFIGSNLNMNFGKLNVYGNYSFEERKYPRLSDMTSKYLTGPYVGAIQHTHSSGNSNNGGHSYKVGVDYYFTKRQVISFMFRGGNDLCDNSNSTSSAASFFNSAMRLDSTLYTRSKDKFKWRNLTFNVNYKWDIDSMGQSLTLDADYDRFRYSSTTEQYGNYTDANGKDMQINSTVFGYQPREINVFSIKADYVRPIGKNFSVEAGLKTSFVKTNSQADFAVDYPSNLIWETGLKANDRFVYTENINAAYISGRGRFGKTSIQMGLRVENTNSNGDSKSMHRVDKRHYTDLFPSLFVMRELNKDNQLGLTYSYRIGRPSYQKLNPFLWMRDQFNYSQGNPFLRPQFTHSLGLNYICKNSFITSLGMSRTNDLSTEVVKKNDITKVMLVSPENLGKSLDLNGSQTVQLSITKWWHFNATGIVMYKSVTADDIAAYKFRRWSFNANSTQSFNLPWGINMELAGGYRSKQLSGVFTSYKQYYVDFGVAKNLFNNKAYVRVAVKDIFNTNKSGGFSKYGNVDCVSYNRATTRTLNVSLSYRFGKDDFKTRSNRTTSSSEEQSRSGR